MMFCAVDLGQRNDYTAIAVLQETPEIIAPSPWGREVVNWLDVVHLDRFRGVEYAEVCERIARLLSLPQLVGNVRLAVDATGVGLPVVELLRARGLSPMGITLTAGSSVNADPVASGWRVPKRDVVAAIDIAQSTERLRIAPGIPHRDQLKKELQGFVATMKDGGRDSYEAVSAALHDDLVIALGLALWCSLRGGNRAVREIDAEVAEALSGGRDEYKDWDPCGSSGRPDAQR